MRTRKSIRVHGTGDGVCIRVSAHAVLTSTSAGLRAPSTLAPCAHALAHDRVHAQDTDVSIDVAPGHVDAGANFANATAPPMPPTMSMARQASDVNEFDANAEFGARACTDAPDLERAHVRERELYCRPITLPSPSLTSASAPPPTPTLPHPTPPTHHLRRTCSRSIDVCTSDRARSGNRGRTDGRQQRR